MCKGFDGLSLGVNGTACCLLCKLSWTSARGRAVYTTQMGRDSRAAMGTKVGQVGSRVIWSFEPVEG